MVSDVMRMCYPTGHRRNMSGMTSAVLRRGVFASVTVAWLVAIGRDVRRARHVARLEPPAPRIDLRIEPRGTAVGQSVEHGDRAAHRPPVRLAALGDSSIAGIGASRLSACLAVQIAERVAAGRGRPVEVCAHGRSGARTADVERQARDLDPAEPPDAIVVVVGANDVAHATPPRRYARAVARVHRDLRDRFHVPVIVCSLPEFRAVTAVGPPLRLIAVAYGRLLGVLQRLALRRVPGASWVDARGRAGPAFLRRPHAMSADGYHPSDLGYALLADALAPAIIAALERPGPGS